MNFDVDSLGLSSESSLTPEDIMLISLEVLYLGSPLWNTVGVNRSQLKWILRDGTLHDLSVQRICLVTWEGEECNLRAEYDCLSHQWEFI